MLRWKASSTRSRPNSSITVTTQHGQKPSAISLPSSKVTTTEPESTRPSATSARSRWSKKQLNPVHFFGGRSVTGLAKESQVAKLIVSTFWGLKEGADFE